MERTIIKICKASPILGQLIKVAKEEGVSTERVIDAAVNNLLEFRDLRDDPSVTRVFVRRGPNENPDDTDLTLDLL
jgi:hypothetical protein